MLIQFLLLFVSITPRLNKAETFAEKYAVWSADLPDGYKIVTEYQDGLRCHCKVPNITTTTTTTTTPVSTTTSTASTTTATPTTTTTTPPTTTVSTTSTTTTASTTTTKTPTTTTSTTSTTPDSTTTSTTTPTTTTTKTPTTTTTTTPESTTTATSTTTTTLTPTSTTTTTSTTPTTTTTATSTTTTTTTTVMAAAPTTTTAFDACGNCNQTLNIDYATTGSYELQTFTWSSPNYPSDYPDGCVCVLQINLNERGYASIGFNAEDAIHSSSNCAYDYLQMTGNNLYQNKICDNSLGSISDYMSKNEPDSTVVSLTAVFVADPADGNFVDKGFMMTVLYQIYEN